MFKALSIQRGREKNQWSVSLHHEESGKVFWVDLSLVNKDIECDWNQYIFYNTDPDDMERKTIQEDIDNFDDAMSEAVFALQKESEVIQDEDANWLCAVADWEEKTWTLMS